MHIFELDRVEVRWRRRLAGVGQQVAGLVDHGDVRRRQFRHAAGDQVDDRADLRPRRACGRDAGSAAPKRWASAGRARTPMACGSARWTRAALHRGQRLDRARQFAFQRALVVDLFEELARRRASGFPSARSRRCRLWAGLARPASGGCRGPGRPAPGSPPPPSANLYGHVHLVERGDDGAAVAVGEIGEQDAVVRLLAPHPDRDHHGQHDRRAGAEQDVAAKRGLEERLRPGGGRESSAASATAMVFSVSDAPNVYIFPTPWTRNGP